MALTGDEKKYIINRMQSLIDTSRGKIINDTQIRKYASMASQADCKEEFFNYLHYQIGRAPGHEKNFLRSVLDEITKMENKFSDEEKYLEALAYFFGYMARYKKFVDKSDDAQGEKGKRRQY
ncbi:MAG: hypothetical protein WC155_02760 [Candidatus Cloacimonadales bacterium]|jgi:hypothetical protein|nr:hypothetical protein [Patescibacteria group bacterium]HOB16477.1 hypothetical protein [Defluviitoga sp.]HPZ29168.1 hypothetical protein [Defluviitoga sp.]HQD63127.1 hypothetical protein [Defluviitoga sp.]